MTITQSKKINMENSSSSSDDDESEKMEDGEAGQATQVPTHTDKQIKKKPKMTRAHFKEMRRELKRRVKIMKLSGSKRKAERMLSTTQENIKLRFRDREDDGAKMDLDQ